MPTDANDVAATATAAADLIERDGLHHDTFWGYPGGNPTKLGADYVPGMQLCILGAIRVAIGDYNDLEGKTAPWGRCATTTAVHRHIQQLGYPCVSNWNDTHGRTTAEAVALLRDVAESHRRLQALDALVGAGTS